jgi:hypothetical protein
LFAYLLRLIGPTNEQDCGSARTSVPARESWYTCHCREHVLIICTDGSLCLHACVCSARTIATQTTRADDFGTTLAAEPYNAFTEWFDAPPPVNMRAPPCRACPEPGADRRVIGVALEPVVRPEGADWQAANLARRRYRSASPFAWGRPRRRRGPPAEPAAPLRPAPNPSFDFALAGGLARLVRARLVAASSCRRPSRARPTRQRLLGDGRLV